MFPSGSGSGPGRPQLGDVSTDPVVVGLGRLLVAVGLLGLAAVGTIAWLILRCVAAG
jgi:hypothetical protein